MSHDRYSIRAFTHRVAAVLAALALVAAAVFGGIYLKWGRGPSVKDHSVLVQPVGGAFMEYPVGGITSGLFAPAEPSLQAILDNLAKAAVDDRVDGVLIQVDMPAVGYAMLDEIRTGVGRVREAGKPVWAWSEMLDLKGLYLASACDSLFLLPTAYIQVTGVYGERMHVKNALDKLGVRLQIDRIESYKAAAEMVSADEMSPQTREMMGWILGDVYPRILAQTSAGLGLEEAELTGLMERTLLTAAEAIESGLADGLREWDEMTGALPRPGGKDEPRLLEGSDYAQIEPADVGIKGDKKVAVIHAGGMVGMKRSGVNPLLGPLIGYESVAHDFERALDDDDVAAIVFRVNSNGGVSLTGDRICRTVEIADRKKPVIVSMVDIAGSAGYSVSYRGRTLVAGANTITGSIGSITGKIVLRDLYDRLGITMDGVGMGPAAGFDSQYRPWTPEEMARMKENHWAEYRNWIADIARHRDMTVADVDSLARGRVWTGAQAVENGLVDELGGLDRAVELAKDAAGLAADEDVTLVHYPQPEGFLAQFLGMPLSVAAERAAAGWIRGRVEEAGRFSRSELRVAEVPVP